MMACIIMKCLKIRANGIKKWNGKRSLHGDLDCDSIVNRLGTGADNDLVPIMRNLLGKRSGKDLFVVDSDRDLEYMMEDLHTDVNVKLVNDHKEAIAK